ncbi:hypothetical protein Dret_2354 [Desulfohalobium retbaense DSM 5692]|uniref:Uncharacterized protein n=1 Tax=Desulfohalobium retbaense (strain ATCC 49708 / DSM 5692 / JCM 16813 / HR100) TaxID=485915 RepID=C8X5E0_DESRD|nr:hypothetical protein Dret_2354 [Desulfohalobium retbaense DSM 5692]
MGSKRTPEDRGTQDTAPKSAIRTVIARPGTCRAAQARLTGQSSNAVLVAAGFGHRGGRGQKIDFDTDPDSDLDGQPRCSSCRLLPTVFRKNI